MVSVVTTTPTMEELIISDAELTLLSQILKSASPRPLFETASEIRQHSSFSQDLDDILVISMESAGILSSPSQIKLEQTDNSDDAGTSSFSSQIKLEQVDNSDDAGTSSFSSQIKLEQADDDNDDDDKADDVEADDDEAENDAEHRAREAEQRAQEAEQRAQEAEQRAQEAEQRAHDAELRAQEAEKNAVNEKRLRGNYYNQQCRIKKEWGRQKVQLRSEISDLKAQIWDLKNEEQKVIKVHRDEMKKKDEQIETSEKDLNLFEAMIAERDRTIERNKSEYCTLLDDLINAKITIEDLKSAI